MDNKVRMKAEIHEYQDGSLCLSCGNQGMDTDLVFASVAMTGDPALETQKQILEHISKTVKNYQYPEWISVHDQLPEDLKVVIVQFSGFWPNHGNHGIRDCYMHNGEWFNIPSSVVITRWMSIPNTLES